MQVMTVFAQQQQDRIIGVRVRDAGYLLGGKDIVKRAGFWTARELVFYADNTSKNCTRPSVDATPIVANQKFSITSECLYQVQELPSMHPAQHNIAYSN